MLRYLSIPLLAGLFIFVGNCGTNVPNALISNNQKLTSTSLNTSSLRAQNLQTVTDCDGTANPTYCTPDDLEGRIMSGSIIWGKNEDGNDNYGVTFYGVTDAVIQDPSSYTGEGESTFKLSTAVTLEGGKMSIPEEVPGNGIIWRVEFYFDYIDATITVTNSGDSSVNGTHKIRFVFRKTATSTDIPDGTEMQVGDKMLYNSSTEKFNWCDSSGCTHTTRPSSPYQDSDIITKYEANQTDGQPGNKNWALYSVDIDEENFLTLTDIALATATTTVWTVDLDVSEAMNIDTNLSSITTIQALVNAVTLGIGSSCSGCTPDDRRIKGKVTVTAGS